MSVSCDFRGGVASTDGEGACLRFREDDLVLIVTDLPENN